MAQNPAPKPTPPLYFDKVEQRYDRFDDSTTQELEFKILSDEKSFSNLRLNLITKFSGKKPALDNSIVLTMISFDVSPIYSKSDNLIFLLGDERLKLNGLAYKSRNVDLYSIQRIDERVSYSISQNDLKKIAYSKKNEAKFGSTEFTIKDESLKLIQNFYNKLVP